MSVFTEAARSLYGLFQMTMSGCRYWVLYILALAVLAIAGKREREGIVFPSVFFIILVYNPVVYALFWRKVSYANWRLFWMVPMEGIICLAGAVMLSKVKTAVLRLVCGLAILGGIMFAGSNVYQTTGCGFEKAENAYRLPSEAVAAANLLLEQEEHPRAVVSEGINCYLRQISTDIQMMYGRDAKGYIHAIDPEKKHVFELLDEEEPDFEKVASEMRRMDYTYIVLWGGWRYDPEVMLTKGFRKIGDVDIYSVYRLTEPGGTT